MLHFKYLTIFTHFFR